MKIKLDLDKLSTPEQILLTDPISHSTRSVRRSLLFFTAITLVAVSYGAESISLPITHLPATALIGALGLIVTYHIVSFVISYITDIQGWHLTYRNTIGADQLKYLQELSSRMYEIDSEFKSLAMHLNAHLVVYKEEFNKISQPIFEIIQKNATDNSSHTATTELNEALQKLEAQITPTNSKYRELTNAANGKYQDELYKLQKAIEYLKDDALEYRKHESTIKRESLQFRFLQYGRVYFWEGGVPLVAALIAILHTTEKTFIFINSIL